MKVRERKPAKHEGFGAHPALVRVVEVPEGEAVPEGAEPVSEETPVCDWRREEE